jgi:hemerythrin-like domain-containing protein
MSMKITDRLKAEHGVFLRQVDHLQDLVRSQASREVLKSVTETIAVAEERHSSLEDRLLYPALARAIGRDFPLLQRSRAAHDELRQLVARIRTGEFDESTVDAFAERLRDHLEHEIHDVFPLAEELLPAEKLVAMANWDVDHIYEVAARRHGWGERRLG